MNRAEVVIRYLRGESMQDIAKRFGVSRETIRSLISEDPLYPIWKKKHWCAKYSRLIDYFWLGYSAKKIRNLLGLTQAQWNYFKTKAYKNGCVPKEVLNLTRWQKRAKQILRELKKGKNINSIAKYLGLNPDIVRVYVWRLKRNKMLNR